VVSRKGKLQRVYRWYATPWQVLRQLRGVAGYLKAELTIAGISTALCFSCAPAVVKADE